MSKEHNKPSRLQAWQTLASKDVFTSKWLKLRQDICRLPSGREIDDYFVIEVPDGAAIVATTEQNELILVRQYKHGFGKMVLELPAGIVEAGENPVDTVSRELREEAGYSAPHVEHITTLVTKPARMAARTFIFFASNVRHEGQTQENDSEVIEIVLVPVSTLPSLIQNGDIVTETSLAALLMVWNRIIQ